MARFLFCWYTKIVKYGQTKYMATNLEVLFDLLKKVEDKPYFVLPDKESSDWLWQLRQLVKGLRNDFASRGFKENVVQLDKINLLVRSDKIDERRLAIIWYDFLLDFYPLVINKIKPTLDKITARSREWCLAEERAREKRLKKTRKEIIDHDYKILENEMQLYALDYFLAVQNIFCVSDDDVRRQLVTVGHKGLPSMQSDAISNDMINKVVCYLWDWFLKVKMTKDFYQYRDSLVVIGNPISHGELENINRSLANYCLSLLSVLESCGVEEVSPGTVSPYGRINVLELKNKLL